MAPPTRSQSATNAIGTGPASSASAAVTPADTILDFTTPTVVDSGDPSANELGVKFTSDTTGAITGIRFYKAAANTGTHVGSLWTAGGTLLASATFTNETASGWQTVQFSTPVAITPGTTYVAGYLDPNGHYSVHGRRVQHRGRQRPAARGRQRHELQRRLCVHVNLGLPTNSFNATNYGVDVLFQPAPPGQVTGVTATASLGGATVNWTAPQNGGATKYIVTPFIGSAAQTTTTVTGTPPATTANITGLTPGTSYTFKVQAVNGNGSGPQSAASNAITPLAAQPPSAPTGVIASPGSGQALVSWTTPNANGSSISSYTVTPFIAGAAQAPFQVNDGSATSATVTGLTNGSAYTFTVSASSTAGTGPASSASAAITPEDTIFNFATPATTDSNDPTTGNLGVNFTSDNNGQIVGLRFYKAAANTGTHIGSLWSSTGTLLASATFTNETASGWQTVLFPTPVSITAGTDYVASYFDPNGRYSYTSAAFSSPFDSAPLHAIATGAIGNGVYNTNATNSFPSNTFNATNYWVDVLFAPTP